MVLGHVSWKLQYICKFQAFVPMDGDPSHDMQLFGLVNLIQILALLLGDKVGWIFMRCN